MTWTNLQQRKRKPMKSLRRKKQRLRRPRRKGSKKKRSKQKRPRKPKKSAQRSKRSSAQRYRHRYPLTLQAWGQKRTRNQHPQLNHRPSAPRPKPPSLQSRRPRVQLSATRIPRTMTPPLLRNLILKTHLQLPPPPARLHPRSHNMSSPYLPV